MPKMKTHKSTAKRFKVTATGRLMRTKISGKSHLRRNKSKRMPLVRTRPGGHPQGQCEAGASTGAFAVEEPLETRRCNKEASMSRVKGGPFFFGGLEVVSLADNRAVWQLPVELWSRSASR